MADKITDSYLLVDFVVELEELEELELEELELGFALRPIIITLIVIKSLLT